MADKYIRDLSLTDSSLADGDLIIVEKGDSSGTKIIKYKDLIESVTNRIVTQSKTITTPGYSIDARELNPDVSGSLAGKVDKLIAGKQYTNYDGLDTTTHNMFTVHTSPFPPDGTCYINANDTIASIVGIFKYDKKDARSVSWTTIMTFTDAFVNNILGRTYLNLTAYVEAASGSESVAAWKGKTITVELDTWNENKRLRIYLPVALATTDSFMFKIGAVIPVTK